MADKFLGLDIGTHTLKAVLLSHSLRGGQTITAARRIDIAGAGGLAGALEQLFSDGSFTGAICVSALPSRSFSFRDLQLPFSEDKKIRQTLAFAVEPLIHLPLDEVWMDYVITGHGKGTDLFVAVVEKKLIGEHKTLLAPYVRESAAIDVGTVPLASIFVRQPDFPSSALILDVGFAHSTAVFAGKERIYHVRDFFFGAKNVTQAVAGALQIDPETAWQIENEIPPEALPSVGGVCTPFLNELKNTSLFLRDRGRIPDLPARILLTGGGARTPGLSEALSKLFPAPVEESNLLASGRFKMDEALRASWDPAIMDNALALAARPPGKGSGFNFLRREQESNGDRSDISAVLKKAALAAGIVVVLAGLELGLDYWGMRLKLANLKRDIISEYKRIDPQTTRIVDPIAQIKGRIAEAKKFSAGRVSPTSATALDILKEVSAAAPKDILLHTFSVEEGEASFKGEAPDFDAMDAFKKRIEGSTYVRSVTVGATSLMKEQKGVEFHLKAALKR